MKAGKPSSNHHCPWLTRLLCGGYLEFPNDVAFQIGCLFVLLSVSLHWPDYFMAKGKDYKLAGMSWDDMMIVGMTLLIVGTILSFVGIYPRTDPVKFDWRAAGISFRSLDESPLNRQHFKVIMALLFALVIDVMKPASLGFILPGFRSEYGLTKTQGQLLPLFALIGTTVGSILWGFLTDRMGRRATILLSAVIFMGTSICGAMPSKEWNFGMCFLMGASAGGMLPAVYALLSELTPVKSRGWLTVLVGGLTASLGYLLPAACASWLEPEFNWRILWFISFPTAIVLLWVQRWIPESPRLLLSWGRVEECERTLQLFGAKLEYLNQPDPNAELAVLSSDTATNGNGAQAEGEHRTATSIGAAILEELDEEAEPEPAKVISAPAPATQSAGSAMVRVDLTTSGGTSNGAPLPADAAASGSAPSSPSAKFTSIASPPSPHPHSALLTAALSSSSLPAARVSDTSSAAPAGVSAGFTSAQPLAPVPSSAYPTTTSEAPASKTYYFTKLFRGHYLAHTLTLCSVGLAWGLVNWGFVTYLPTNLEDMGVQSSVVGKLLSLAALISLPFVALFAYLYGYWRTKGSLCWALVCMCLSLVGFCILDTKSAHYQGAFVFLMCCLIGPISAVIGMLSPYSAEIYGTDVRGWGGGVIAGSSKFGGVVGPFMVSAIDESIGGGSIYGGGVLCLVAVALSALAIYIWGVETRGRTLEQVELAIQKGHHRNSLSVSQISTNTSSALQSGGATDP